MKETRDKIILKALQYSTENDYEGASLEKIAGSIGITKGGIYHYFKSKDELFHECIVFMFSTVDSVASSMVPDDISLEGMVRGLFSFEELFNVLADMFDIDMLNDYFNYAYLMFAGIKKFPDLKNMVGDIYSSILLGLEKALIGYQRKGELSSDFDCGALAFELGSMMEGAMLVSGFSRSVDIKKIGNSMADDVIAMLKGK